MGFLDRLTRRETRSTPALPAGGIASSDPFLMTVLGLDRGGRNFAGGEEVLSTVAVAARCVGLISEGLASLPLRVRRWADDGGSTIAPTHPLDALLNDVPNPSTSAFMMREGLVADVLTHGNGFLRQEIDGRGRVSALHYMPWRMTGVERLQTGRLRYRFTDPVLGTQVFTQEEVVHLRYRTRDGVIGISPLAWAGNAIGLAVSQTALAHEQVDRGFASDVAFTMDGSFGDNDQSKAAFQRLKDQLTERMNKLRRIGSPLVLEAGLKPSPLNVNGREAQFMEARLRGMADVAAVFGVPLSVLGLGTHASYGSLTEESRALARDCFRPWARRIESELVRSLLTTEGRRTFTIAHDMSGLLAGDMRERFTAYQLARQAEVLSSNECRAMEGLPPRPGGDEFSNPATSGRTTGPAPNDPSASRESPAEAQPAEA